MPHIVHHGERYDGYTGQDFEYEYPEGLDFKPGSKLHKKIVNEVMQRARESSLVMSNRFPSWNKIDKSLTTYIDLDEGEEAVKKADERKPVSIVFPYSYAILETILGYLVSAFFQEPMFRYEGVSPEDTIGAIMLEKVIDLHCNKSKVALNLHTMFRDGLSYGFGVGAPTWVKRYGFKTVKKPTGFIGALTGVFKKTGMEKDVVEAVLFEGNKLNNIDPYLCLPDPNVSIHEVQEGEFFGWVNRTNYMQLLKEEVRGDDYFNIKYVKSVMNKRTSIYGEDKSERNKKAGYGITRGGSNTTNPVDEINMFIELIPKEWELSDSEYPEKWFFSLAADTIVTRAQPLDLDHDMYPTVICAPDFDGYSVTPISRLETLYGLQGTLDWLFNAHIANVRKAINDMFVYDPYLINSKDLKDPKAGKLIRLRRPGWGRGVKDVIQQLGVQDITKQHIGDSSFIVQFMNKISGTDDFAMGQLRQGGPERLTGAEFEGTQRGTFTRLERVARIIGLQCMQDLGYFFASHTQQMMDEELYVKTSGRWQQVLLNEYGNQLVKDKGRMKVTPFDVLIDYDVMVRDGSVPGNNFSGVWTKMFEIMMKSPEMAGSFDIVRIFSHIARNNGAKNVEEFIKTKTMPDEQVERGVEKGNIVPAEEYMNAQGGVDV